MRFLDSFALVCAATLLMSSCASTLRPVRPNELHLTSTPDSATVIVNGHRYAATPLTLELPTAEQYIIEYHKAGYRPAFDTIVTSVSTPWLITDIVFSIPTLGLPLLEDYLSGRWYTIDKSQERRSVALVPHRQAAWLVFHERLVELASFAERVRRHDGPAVLDEVGAHIRDIAHRLEPHLERRRLLSPGQHPQSTEGSAMD